MNDFTASQLPAIARRVLEEQKTGQHVDPYRLEWAKDVLRYFDARDVAAGKRIGIEQQQEQKAA